MSSGDECPGGSLASQSVWPEQCGGIVLCGGRSTRMGQPKLSLDFQGEPMLARVVRLLKSTASRIIIVAAPEQEVPEAVRLGCQDMGEVEIRRDDIANCGPIAGLVVGLEALQETHAAAFVTACDTPLLVPALVQRLFAELGSWDCVVPQEGEFCHPLAAVYRTGIAPTIREQIVHGERSLQRLVDSLKARRIPVAELRSVDPDLQTLLSLNTPAEFLAAIESAGSR